MPQRKRKTEVISIRVSNILDRYLSKRARDMAKDLGEHIPKSEVARKILNAHMYHYVMPDSGTEEFDIKAAEFEKAIREELKKELEEEKEEEED